MSGSVWYISFSKKKVEFKKYPFKKKGKRTRRKAEKKFLFSLITLASLFFFSGIVSAAEINDTLHINLQATYSNGSIQEGTFVFAFNITENSSASCLGPIAYNYSVQKTTDSRGIISIYLPQIGSGGGNLSSLDFDKQYYLCYYRDGTLKDVSQLGRVPYSFRATQVNLSEVNIDSNLTLGNFNVSASSGFFSFLGSLVNRITTLFVGNINATGNIQTAGNVSGQWFLGLINASNVSNAPWITTDSTTNTSYRTLTNLTFVGDSTFNGGWQNGGVSITGGNIFAQTMYVYNISSLSVSHLNINGSMIPYFDNQFDLGNATFRWRD
ncbi:MAG: hypothetical protein AABX50_02165, partial [Nanoarchaeota archaeon]